MNGARVIKSRTGQHASTHDACGWVAHLSCVPPQATLSLWHDDAHRLAVGHSSNITNL
jgi:hypothetical protein